MSAPIMTRESLWKLTDYKPFAQQRLFHDSASRFRLANCGRRFGKSTMAGEDMESKLFQKDKLFWIVGPTYDLGEKEFRVIWQDLIVKLQLGRDSSIRKAYNKKQGNMFIKFPWGTEVVVRSADHPENLVGDALDWVIMSEAAKHKQETWERFIRPALADKRGGADFPTTPEGFNWYYDMWMLGQDATLPEYSSWKFPSWANSVVYPGGFDDPEIQLLRKTMAKEAFDQEIGADFGSFVGKIYPEWDAAVHVTNVPFLPHLPNYIAFDWGYTNPLAAVEFQITPSDEIRVWRVHYKAYERVEEHCRMIREQEQPSGYRIDLCFGDAADPEAAETVSLKLAPCVADPNAKTNWREGIDLVRSFLEREIGQDEHGGPIYGPALLVDFKCKELINEFNNYKAPQSVKGKNVQEIGLKQDDHALDALRYGLVHIYKLGATYSLGDVMMANSTSWQSARENFTNTLSSNDTLSLGSGTETGFFTLEGGF